jgi:hypothetical protein
VAAVSRRTTFIEVTAAAVKLPEVEVSKSYGTAALKVRGKLMARLKEDGETLVLRTDLVARKILTQADPDTFFYTDHYRDYPLVLVRLAKLSAAALPDLLERAWRLVAPPALIARLDAQKQAARR